MCVYRVGEVEVRVCVYGGGVKGKGWVWCACMYNVHVCGFKHDIHSSS